MEAELHLDKSIAGRFKYAITLTILTLVAEVVGGIWTNSLALLSDAAHVFLDVFALVLSLVAIRLASYPATDTRTFGWHRAEVFASFINGAIGLAMNLLAASALHQHSHDDLNVHSAFLHVIGDAATSVGVIVAGVVIYFTNWYILDPIISVLIGCAIFWGAWRVLRESTHILLEGTPRGLKTSDVVETIRGIEGV